MTQAEAGKLIDDQASFDARHCRRAATTARGSSTGTRLWQRCNRGHDFQGCGAAVASEVASTMGQRLTAAGRVRVLLLKGGKAIDPAIPSILGDYKPDKAVRVVFEGNRNGSSGYLRYGWVP